MVRRDKEIRADLDEAKRLLEELGLEGEVEEAREVARRVEDTTSSREFATLYEIGQIINSILDLDPLLERITDLAIETLDAERGLIILLDERTGEHRVTTARNVEQETTADALRYSQSVVAAAAEGRSILSSDAVHDERYRDFKSVSLFAIKSFMCVPMRMRDRLVGTVYVDSRRIGGLFDKTDLRFLEAFANQAALAIENARLLARLRDENQNLRQVVSKQFGFDSVIARSASMRRVIQTLSRVAGSSAPVLLTGESGTGKDLFAKAIHVASARREGPFVALNCAAVPSELLESELFGHARGSFSGAEREKKGLLEAAERGTFFFDEIAEMTPALQAKLLRAVEEGAIRRVGETAMRPIDVRLVSATNRNLKEEISSGRFREDLFYRLNVVNVRIPPLRERPDDIVPLAEHFLALASSKSGRRFEGFTRDAIDVLTRWRWPGNVRELENAVERAVALADDARIAPLDLPEEMASGGNASDGVPEGASSEVRAAALWTSLIDEGRSFWDVVREPFLRRELSREDVRRLIERGLGETDGSYKDLAERFHVGDQYKKFHSFLKNSGCHIDRSSFNRRSA